MKSFIGVLIVFTMFTGTQALANDSANPKETVLQVISEETNNHGLIVSEETFAYNVNAYGCQWPGLNIYRYLLRNQLNHELNYGHFGSDQQRLAIGIKDPNYQFCRPGSGTMTEVFGPGFIIGTELKMKIKNRLDIRLIEYTDHDGRKTTHKILKETITILIQGHELETAAQISLAKE